MILKRFAFPGTGRSVPMADYIYLLQNRLTPAQWRALEAVREAARALAMPVFLVGGAVRDLTTGSPVRDLDFAVQGDARRLVGELESRGGTVVGENPAYGSVFLTFRGGLRVEVAPTLSITYPKPGQPESQPAVILDDLRRRGFTANAMAVSLNEGSYGLLLDPMNGTADIENRELRLVSPYGFIEQPALLLRAARLSDRLGWTLEERTQTRYENSKEENHIQALSAFDRGYEIEEIFHEEDPVSILEHLAAEGWRDALFPQMRAEDADRKGIDEVRDLLGQIEALGLHPDPSAVTFPFVTAKMKDADRAALKAAFARQGFVRQIEGLEARSKELASQITSKTAALPSDTWRLLMDSDPEVLLYLALHSRSGAVQSKIKSFLKEWPQMRQKMPYALMQEMRITPDLPEYEKILDDLFFALIDGKLDTPEATRAFLAPFSPPAPPQVTVRRRPAKAARGRGKRSAEEVTAEPADVDEDADDQDVDDDSSDGPARGRFSGDDDDEDDSPAAAAADDDEDETDDDEDEPVEDTKPATQRSKTRVEPEDEPVKALQASAGAGGPGKPTKSGAAGKASTTKKAVPAKAPAKAIAPVVVAPVAAKAAAKAIPSKIAAKAPASTAVKAPEKKVAAKQPVKTAAPVAAKKVVVVKAPAKDVKPAAQKAVPAKATPAPVKVAAKKVAVKGRSGR